MLSGMIVTNENCQKLILNKSSNFKLVKFKANYVQNVSAEVDTFRIYGITKALLLCKLIMSCDFF